MGDSDQMSVVWASQTETPQHHNRHGRHTPNWSVRRLVLALLIVALHADAGQRWRGCRTCLARGNGAVAGSTLAATPAFAPPRGASSTATFSQRLQMGWPTDGSQSQPQPRC